MNTMSTHMHRLLILPLFRVLRSILRVIGQNPDGNCHLYEGYLRNCLIFHRDLHNFGGRKGLSRGLIHDVSILYHGHWHRERGLVE